MANERTGRFELGPYQGRDRSTGYRLAVRPGGHPVVELLRVSRGTAAVVERYENFPGLDDEYAHNYQWTRSTDGEMSVSVDGKELFRVVDRGIRASFDGIELVNAGGDFAVREISIYSAR